MAHTSRNAVDTFYPMRCNANITSLTLLVFGLASMLPIARAQDTGTTPDNNPARMVLRRIHPETYKGGRTLEVRVNIAASRWEGLTAVGLYEKIPEGWSLSNVGTLGGPAPAVVPEPGDSDVLQFLWITPPNVPVSLRYELTIPPRHGGVRDFSGQIEYRLGAGKLVSNVALTRLDGEADELPVLSMQGASQITITRGDDFTDAGATARDKEDGDLTAKVQVTGRVNDNQPGTYSLVYGVVDSVGNRAVPLTRVVTVREKTEPPSDGGGGVGVSPPTNAPEAPATAVSALPPARAAEDESPTLFSRDWIAGLQPELGRDLPVIPQPGSPDSLEEPAPSDRAKDEPTGRIAGRDPAAVMPQKQDAGSLAHHSVPESLRSQRQAGNRVERLVAALGLTFLAVGTVAWWFWNRDRVPRWSRR